MFLSNIILTFSANHRILYSPIKPSSMKKIFTLLVFSTLFISCKKNPSGSVESPEENTTTSVSAKGAACKWPLYFTKSTLPADFETQNKNYICSADSTFVLVDLTVQSNTDTIAAWLKQNDQYIDFPASYQSIEDSHIITAATHPVIDSLTDNDFKVLSISDIKEKVEMLGKDFVDQYDYFMSFSLQNGTVNLSTIDFTANGTCYSVPLFSSIISNHNLNNATTKFEFAQVSLNGQPNIIFRVKVSGAFIYYDISNNPPVH